MSSTSDTEIPRAEAPEAGVETDGRTRFLIWTIIASQFVPSFMFSGVAVALPQMGRELHAGAVSLGLVETLFMASQLAFLLPVGRLADTWEKKSLYQLGFAVFGLSSIAIGFLSSIPLILFFRFIQGLASATFATTGPALLMELAPPDRRGRVFGASTGMIYAGLTLGPIAAGYLVGAAGWRSVFFAGGALLIFGALATWRAMAVKWTRPTGRLDIKSSAMVAGGVFSIVAGASLIRYPAAGVSALIAGLALCTAFILRQRTLDTPLLDVGEILRNTVLRRALLVQLLLYLNAFSTIFMLNVFLQVCLGEQPETSGQVIAVGSVIMAMLAPLTGRLSDVYPPRIIAGAGAASLFLTVLLALTLDTSASAAWVMLVLTFHGIGFALFSTPNMTLIMSSVRPDQAGMVSALSAKARSIGMVGGMLVTTLMTAIYLGNEPLTARPEGFMHVMTGTFGTLCVTTILALVLVARPAAKE